MLAVFKGIAALKVDDRRSRQTGSFGVVAAKEKLICKITTQGTKTGERALLQIEQAKIAFKSLDELGMRPKTQEQIEALFSQSGLVVFSSLPGGGLTTTMDVVLSNTDRYVRNFVVVEDAKKKDRDIENIHSTTYSAAEGETPAAVLPKLIRTYPDVIIVREVPDLSTLEILCEQAGENRLVITSVRAKDASEALLRLMMLKIPPADFAAAVTAVVNVRLIRRLCEKCKEGYPPPAEVLKQLGLPAGRIEALYRPPTQPIDPKHPDVVCEDCLGVGYIGRTALFEVLIVDDSIREVLTTAPKLENLRSRRPQVQAALAAGRGGAAGGPRRHLDPGTFARAQAIEVPTMLTAIVLFIIFAGAFALLFNNGLWTNTLMLINVLTAGLLATNYFEPLADWFDKQEPSAHYVWDFVAIWLIFGVAMTILRVITDYASRVKVRFLAPVDKAGGMLMAVWVSWVLVCFSTATFHTAPLSRSFFGESFRPNYDSRVLFGLDPDLVWLGWVNRESRTTFSRWGDVAEFDRDGHFILRYGERRDAFDHQLTLLKGKDTGGGLPK